MSGNGTSTNFSLDGSAPWFSCAARVVTSPRLFSVFTAIVLPSRSLADLIELPFLTSIPLVESLSDEPPCTPSVTMRRSIPRCLACSSEMALPKANWISLAVTAGTASAPPWIGLGSTFSFSSLKKPFWTPR